MQLVIFALNMHRVGTVSKTDKTLRRLGRRRSHDRKSI